LQAATGNALTIMGLPHRAITVDETLPGVHAAEQVSPDSRIFAPHFFAFDAGSGFSVHES
jgi:hypothetical protein